MDKVRLSYQLLILGYSLLACLYLYATIMNSIANFSGNRNIASSAILLYSLTMVFGLIKFRKIFCWVSAMNFIVGCFAILYLIVGLTITNGFLFLVLLLGLTGLILSIKAVVGWNGI